MYSKKCFKNVFIDHKINLEFINSDTYSPIFTCYILLLNQNAFIFTFDKYWKIITESWLVWYSFNIFLKKVQKQILSKYFNVNKAFLNYSDKIKVVMYKLRLTIFAIEIRITVYLLKKKNRGCSISKQIQI